MNAGLIRAATSAIAVGCHLLYVSPKCKLKMKTVISDLLVNHIRFHVVNDFKRISCVSGYTQKRQIKTVWKRICFFIRRQSAFIFPLHNQNDEMQNCGFDTVDPGDAGMSDFDQACRCRRSFGNDPTIRRFDENLIVGYQCAISSSLLCGLKAISCQ